LWAYQRVFHGEPSEENKKFPELRLKEGLVLLPFLGLIVFMGVYPKPVLDRIEPSIDALITRVEANTTYVEPEPTIEIGEHSDTGDESDDTSDEPTDTTSVESEEDE
jgi:NADH-quinone oxidoreductase subunit M